MINSFIYHTPNSNQISNLKLDPNMSLKGLQQQLGLNSEKSGVNKHTSLEAMLVGNYNQLTESLTNR